MAINFPDSPALNDTYIVADRVWSWDGSGWKRTINAGQVVSVFILAGPFVDDPLALPVPLGLSSFELVNYV